MTNLKQFPITAAIAMLSGFLVGVSVIIDVPILTTAATVVVVAFWFCFVGVVLGDL